MTPDHIDFALMLLRVLVATVMLAHACNHLVLGGRIPGTARWFESLGMRPGVVHAWLASGTEAVVGVLLLLGLLTQLAAAGVVGVITVAWITNHLGNGYFIFRKGEGWEWVSSLAFSAVALGTMGPGAWSLDRAIGFELDGAASLGTTLLGAAAAALLLLVAWRPSEEKRKPALWVVTVFAVYVLVGVIGAAYIDTGFDDAIVEPDQISYGVLILRVVLGVVMLAHGYNHVFRGGRIEGTGRWFESLGMRPGVLHAWLASATELAVGVLLIVGLLTPLAAAGVAGVLVVAWAVNHVPNGYFTFRPGEGWEYVSFLSIAAIVVGTIGGGEISLDNALDVSGDLAGFGGGLALALLGPLLALLLLLVFWRPAEVRNPRGVLAVFAFFAVLGLLGALASQLDEDDSPVGARPSIEQSAGHEPVG